MNDLDNAVNKATAIIFLNQQWIARLGEIIEDAGLMDDVTLEFIQNAKTENRKAFHDIKNIINRPAPAGQ